MCFLFRKTIKDDILSIIYLSAYYFKIKLKIGEKYAKIYID